MGKPNIKNMAVKELNALSELVDLDVVNTTLKANGITKLELSKKTLMNIGKWALNGASETEIRNNLELTAQEWAYLLHTCPSVVIILQHSTAFADMIVGGTLLETAIGGKVIRRKVPLKVKEYEVDKKTGKSYVVGEHWENIEVEETTPPNPMLLKFLAENKLSEKFGDKKVDNSKNHRDIIDTLTDEQIRLIEEYKNKK